MSNYLQSVYERLRNCKFILLELLDHLFDIENENVPFIFASDPRAIKIANYINDLFKLGVYVVYF